MLSDMYKFQLYHRCHLYGDTSQYLTCEDYKGQRERDNGWIMFQHHTKRCAIKGFRRRMYVCKYI